LTPPRVPLLVNLASGGAGRRLGLARLRAAPGLEVVVTRGAEELRQCVRRAVLEGRTRILIAGGDGTQHLAIQELAGSGCALGIVPIGSGNDLARALGLPRDVPAAVRHALAATPRTIDLGEVAGRRFAGAASFGLDAEVARRARERAGAGRGRWIYPWIALRALATFRPPEVRVDHDGGRFTGPVLLVAVANSPCYGGGMRIAPGATLDDGWLDLVLVRAMPRLRALALLPGLYRGRHVRHPAVQIVRVRRATITCAQSLPIFGDGEPLGEAGPRGITIGVAPGALRVLA
jgi:diacylglycerol kinase (ATP)